MVVDCLDKKKTPDLAKASQESLVLLYHDEGQLSSTGRSEHIDARNVTLHDLLIVDMKRSTKVLQDHRGMQVNLERSATIKCIPRSTQ